MMKEFLFAASDYKIDNVNKTFHSRKDETDQRKTPNWIRDHRALVLRVLSYATYHKCKLN